MQGIRFVYFDLDDTLLDHRRAERLALAELCEVHAPALGHIPVDTVRSTYAGFNQELWRRYGAGEITQEDLRRLRFEQVIEALALSDVTPAQLDEDYLSCYANHWEYLPGAREAFLAIANRYPVGVLTNGFSITQHAKLDRFPEIRDRLASLIISDDYGVMKPDRRLFEAAAREAGTPPESILYIGDSLESDVRGGLGAGWKVAWFANGSAPAPEDAQVLRFNDWTQLTDALIG